MIKNPIIRGFNPDPSICRVKNDFYLVTSTFEFFPGVPIYHSKNLVNWEIVGYCLNNKEYLNLDNANPSGGIFAPTIRYFDKKFYMTTTDVSTIGNFIVSAENIKGPWSKPIQIKQGGIDPSLLYDNGKVYFSTTTTINNETGIYLCEINPDTGVMLTESKLIAKGSGGKHVEAPHIYKIGNYYYLLVAEGGTEYGHMETAFRSKDIYGPYEACPHNPIASHKDLSLSYSNIQCIGHGDLVDDQNGNWWFICLGIRKLNSGFLHNLGRETFLTECNWINDWPVIGNNGIVEKNLDFIHKLPSEVKKQNFDFIDSFTSSYLNLEYTYIRNPDFTKYVLNKGELSLYGANIELFADKKSPTFLAIRQKEHDCKCVAKFEIKNNTKAGITAYYNENYNLSVFAEKNDNEILIGVEKIVHGIKIKNYLEKLHTDKIKLIIKSNMEYYTFFIEKSNQIIEIDKAPVACLCTEGTMKMTFTGTFFGIFCVKGESKFSEFSITNI